MRWIKLIPILILLASISTVQAVCTGQVADQYPGWEARFNASAGVGDVIKNDVNGAVGMKDLRVEILKILGGEIVNLRVSKKGVYEEDFSVTKSTKNFDITLADIRVKVVTVTAATVNLTVYTHDQAIINATTNVTYETSDLNGTLPGEEVEIETEIKNIGELEAKNLQLTEKFADLEIISKDLTQPSSFCYNSSFTIKYKLKAPLDIREDTNYTLYLEFTYSDHNTQLDLENARTKEIPIEIVVKPARLTVTKSGGNWTLLNTGREITISNIVENPANTTAFNVNLIDTPPSDFEIVSGQSSLVLGRLSPGDKKTRSYTVISNDPIYCLSSSKATYEDELGNSYTTYSERSGTRFSPFVTINKTVKDNPIFQNLSYEWPIKTRRSMKSDFSDIKPAAVTFTADAIMRTYEGVAYWSLCQGAFFNRSFTNCIDNDVPDVLINRSSEIIVEIKNVGNTIARGITAKERFKNIDYTGDISWNGTLLPGEVASYNYTAVPVAPGIDIETTVSYLDVDTFSIEETNVEGYSVGVCTKKLTNITFTSPGNFSFTYPDLNIFQPSVIKVYEDSKFDFMPVISNDGSERIFDIEVDVEFGDLTLIKGQKTHIIDDLGRGFEPFGTCNIAEWNDVNITSHTDVTGYGKRYEVIYELKSGAVRVYVDGVITSSSTGCDGDGLEITHDVTIYQRYPYHVPPETTGTTKYTKEITYKIRGNPTQRNLAFWTPSVENQTYIPLTTTVSYEDFFGNSYQREFTTDVFVVPAGVAFVIVRVERTDLGIIINYSAETELAEPGQLNLELVNKGYAPIEKYTLNLSLPQNIEVATNDSNWTGRIEAQIKRANDTLYVFSGDISRVGNISRGRRDLLPMSIKGLRSGIFDIPYKISYDGKVLEGSFKFKVKGPVLKATKELSKTHAETDDEITIRVNVKNTGDGNATNVIVSDGVPSFVPIISGRTQLSVDVLGPGEEVNLTYKVKATTDANMGGTKVSWQDGLGNSYTGDLEPISLTVVQPEKPPTVTEAPSGETPTPTFGPGKIFPIEPIIEEEVFEISSREGIAVLALTLVVMVIIFKLITLKVPAKEEE
jgi:uncharacterized repeat protein (TIGR01451 family)